MASFNWSALGSLAKNNPQLAANIVGPLLKAAASDPAIIADLGKAVGGSTGTFIETHASTVAAVAGIASSAVEANPQIITEALAAFSVPAPSGAISNSGGGA